MINDISTLPTQKSKTTILAKIDVQSMTNKEINVELYTIEKSISDCYMALKRHQMSKMSSSTHDSVSSLKQKVSNLERRKKNLQSALQVRKNNKHLAIF